MSADRIESLVEQMVNKADTLFMSRRMTQAQYDRRLKAIDRWAERQYRMGA